jgi:hypothetical protein
MPTSSNHCDDDALVQGGPAVVLPGLTSRAARSTPAASPRMVGGDGPRPVRAAGLRRARRRRRRECRTVYAPGAFRHSPGPLMWASPSGTSACPAARSPAGRRPCWSVLGRQGPAHERLLAAAQDLRAWAPMDATTGWLRRRGRDCSSRTVRYLYVLTPCWREWPGQGCSPTSRAADCRRIVSGSAPNDRRAVIELGRGRPPAVHAGRAAFFPQMATESCTWTVPGHRRWCDVRARRPRRPCRGAFEEKKIAEPCR